MTPAETARAMVTVWLAADAEAVGAAFGARAREPMTAELADLIAHADEAVTAELVRIVGWLVGVLRDDAETNLDRWQDLAAVMADE